MSICSEIGIACTKTQEDTHGWDILAEIGDPSIGINTIANFRQSTKCLVQIKTTTRQGANPSIKLSSLEHLVRSGMPSFIAFMYCDESLRTGDQTSITHLVHIGRRMIDIVIKEVLACNAAGIQTHKKSITVPKFIINSSKITKNEQILGIMRGASNEFAGNYSASKEAYINEAGTERFLKCRILSIPETSLQDPFNHVRQVFNVADIQIQTSRFGTKIPGLRQEHDFGVLEIKRLPHATGSLQIATSNDVVKVPGAKLHQTKLSNASRELLIETKYVDLRFIFKSKDGGERISYELVTKPFEDEVKLSDWIEIYKQLILLNAKEITFTFFKNGKKWLSLPFVNESRSAEDDEQTKHFGLIHDMLEVVNQSIRRCEMTDVEMCTNPIVNKQVMEAMFDLTRYSLLTAALGGSITGTYSVEILSINHVRAYLYFVIGPFFVGFVLDHPATITGYTAGSPNLRIEQCEISAAAAFDSYANMLDFFGDHGADLNDEWSRII